MKDASTKGTAGAFEGFGKFDPITLVINGERVRLTSDQAHDVWMERERRFFAEELEYRLSHLDEYPQYRACREAIDKGAVSADDFLRGAWDSYLDVDALQSMDECAGV